jgi:hypothetical protein
LSRLFYDDARPSCSSLCVDNVCQAFLINILTPKENAEFTYKEPSPLAMQWTPFAVYVFVLTLLHHGYVLFLEWLSFGSFLDFIVKVIITTAISLLLTFTVELLFPRRLRFQTNTP